MTLTTVLLEICVIVFFIFLVVKIFTSKGVLHKKTKAEKELFFESLVSQENIISEELWDLNCYEIQEFNSWYKKNKCLNPHQ